MKKRSDRLDDEPRLDKKGEPVTTFPWAGDVLVFKLLNRYRNLPIDFIVAHTGLSYGYLRDRLDLLSRKPNKYLNRNTDQHNRPHAGSRFLIYELDRKGIEFLKTGSMYSKEPCLGDKHLFSHSLLVSVPIVSLELAHPGEMIWWPEIAKRIENPKRFIPVRIAYRFKEHNETLDFDYYNDSNGAFGIRYGDGTARFFSLEAERTTDTKRDTLKTSSFLKKLLAMMYIEEHKLYVKQWGLPNLIHLVVCPSQHMVDERKDLILELTGGKGLTYIGFAVVPDLANPREVAKPDARLFTEGWQRAGHPDLFLNSPTAKKAAA
jgi:hypothetical protein